MSWPIKDRPRIAIAGATGAVGRELLALLESRGTELSELVLLASARSAGREVPFRGAPLAVRELTEDAFDGVDIALFSCGKERSLRFGPAAAERGAIVIDNSSAFRLDEGVPLVVPEVNAGALFDGGELASEIIANPNCSTILLVVVLAPIARAWGLERAVVATYQAASGAGQQGIDALEADTKAWIAGAQGDASSGVFGHPLAFNLVPHIDEFFADDWTGEERKMLLESRKILDLPELAMDVTCVRVPVMRCHSESVSVATSRPATVAEARAVLAEADGVEVVDEPGVRRYPMPLDASGRDPVLVGRMRASNVFPGGLSFWLSGDQLLKGAALNAMQIAEALIRQAGAPERRRDRG